MKSLERQAPNYAKEGKCEQCVEYVVGEKPHDHVIQGQSHKNRRQLLAATPKSMKTAMLMATTASPKTLNNSQVTPLNVFDLATTSTGIGCRPSQKNRLRMVFKT